MRVMEVNLLLLVLIHLPESLQSFFFQAEVGIRDRRVTGVQTCALPIWGSGRSSAQCRVDEVRGLPGLVRLILLDTTERCHVAYLSAELKTAHALSFSS